MNKTSKKYKAAKGKPFKLTQELIRLANNSGWTQKEIAEKCRVHQSIVSGWSRGTKFGREDQLKPLLDKFGHKLRRYTFRLYQHTNNNTQTKEYYRIEGRIILSKFSRHKKTTTNNPQKSLVPTKGLIIHHQGEECFQVIMQSRMGYLGKNTDTNDSDQISSNFKLSEQNAIKKASFVSMHTLEAKIMLDMSLKYKVANKPISYQDLSLDYVIYSENSSHCLIYADIESGLTFSLEQPYTDPIPNINNEEEYLEYLIKQQIYEENDQKKTEDKLTEEAIDSKLSEMTKIHSLTTESTEYFRLSKKYSKIQPIAEQRLKDLEASEGFNHTKPSTAINQIAYTKTSALWNSTLCQVSSIQSLIDLVETYSEHLASEDAIAAIELPFLIREALLNHGFTVENIGDYPAKW